MPELPEVETVRRGLAPVLTGATIVRLETRRPDLRFPLPDNFAARLKGARILSLARRGKVLLAPTDRDETLIMHLGMTGRFTISQAAGGAGAPGAFARAISPAAHVHVIFHLRDAQVSYADPRRFGFMRLTPNAELAADPSLRALGLEPLSDAALTGKALKAALRGGARPIKSALLDQSRVAGLGNIYVCEALHRAGLAPDRAVDTLSARDFTRLAVEIRATLEEAIAAGGSTLRDFAAADGAMGYFQHAFKVYGRAGEPCGGCGAPILRRVQAGRSTFYCPACQH